jgi:uncharacterized protein (TIGR02611 family)
MRIVTIVAGFALLAAGIAMLVLPGPGLLAIFAGLAILAREFHWARRLLDRLKNTAARVRGAVGKDTNDTKAAEPNRSGDH